MKLIVLLISTSLVGFQLHSLGNIRTLPEKNFTLIMYLLATYKSHRIGGIENCKSFVLMQEGTQILECMINVFFKIWINCQYLFKTPKSYPHSKVSRSRKMIITIRGIFGIPGKQSVTKQNDSEKIFFRKLQPAGGVVSSYVLRMRGRENLFTWPDGKKISHFLPVL